MKGRTIEASLWGGTIRVTRLGRCPDSGEWCTSSCIAYGVAHDSTWVTVLDRPYPARWQVNDFIRELRPLLLAGIGDNHAIDVTHYSADGIGGFQDCGWEWVDRGDDLDSKDAINRWLTRLNRMLTGHRRLRLYGDSHPVRAVA